MHEDEFKKQKHIIQSHMDKFVIFAAAFGVVILVAILYIFLTGVVIAIKVVAFVLSIAAALFFGCWLIVEFFFRAKPKS